MINAFSTWPIFHSFPVVYKLYSVDNIHLENFIALAMAIHKDAIHMWLSRGLVEMLNLGI